jgi:hypothetical protein
MEQEPQVQEQEIQNPEGDSKADPFVERAMEMGWRPEEEWDGAPEDFIDAKEFVRRQPLFEKIDHQSRELKELRRAFDAFKQHHSKVKEAEYTRALAALKAERRRALSDGETDKALYIEDKIDEIQEQKEQFDASATTSTPAAEPETRPEFVQWRQSNSWYGRDIAMTAVADRLGVEYTQEGYTSSEVLAKVAREIKKEFPHKFRNERRERAPAVEGGSRMSISKDEEFQLSDDERRIMNRMVSAGAMTKEEYIKELKRIRG